MENKFWETEKPSLAPLIRGSAEEKDLMDKIDQLSAKFDNDPALQQQYDNNFYMFMAQSLREKGAKK